MPQRRIKTVLAWLAIIAVSGVYLADSATTETGIRYSGVVSYVVDGDTLHIRGRSAPVRLWGVDAPEKDMKGFHGAKNALFQMASGKRLTCDEIDRDRYRRSVARCYLSDGREINRLMIEGGTAKEYLYFSRGAYSR